MLRLKERYVSDLVTASEIKPGDYILLIAANTGGSEIEFLEPGLLVHQTQRTSDKRIFIFVWDDFRSLSVLFEVHPTSIVSSNVLIPRRSFLHWTKDAFTGVFPFIKGVFTWS